jgi:ankyrin repeat protein
MWMRSAVLLSVAVTSLAAGNSSDDFYRAVRANDLAQLKRLIASEGVDAKDRHGATPLMYAAAVGSPEAVKMLLAAGADAKVKNAFDATPLMWAAANMEKVRLLVNAGADVNARSKQGMTPLLVAASTAGSIDIVRFLIAHGADLKRHGETATEPSTAHPSQQAGMPQQNKSADAGGFTPLLAAASANDLEMVRLFVEKGVDVNAATAKGDTPLQFAAGAGNLAMVKLLLSKGADVNAATTGALQVRKGPIGLNHLTPLLYAAPYGTPELVKTLIDAGAKVNAQDIRGMTPLMLAVASETQNPDVVRLLLEKGADVRTKSLLDETALDWARKYGNPEVIGLLQKAGGEAAQNSEREEAVLSEQVDARAAIARSVALLQRSSTEFFKESGCVGCHHQNFAAMAVAAARKVGVGVDEAAAQEQSKVVKSQWMAFQEGLLQRVDPPGASDTLTYSLLGLAAAAYPADAITDAMIINVAEEQDLNGSWCYGALSRSPIEESCIGRAAARIRVMQVYGPPGLKGEFDKRIVRARDYLLRAQPQTTDDHAMLLLGLNRAGAGDDKVREAAKSLLAIQRADGGWAGNPHLDSDAYSTGESLYALQESGALRADDTAYRSGAAFLLKTQHPDGSWHVKSRAVKFQPYFQSGFPYDHDQWISAAGTAWATVALANGIEAVERAAR